VPDVTAIVRDVHRRLRAHGKAERRAIAKSYFPTAMKVFGVTVPDLRHVVRDLGKQLKKVDPETVIRTAQALVDGGSMEGRQVGYEILSRHRDAMAVLTTATLEKLGKGIDNWGSVDTFACMVSGPAWREGSVSDSVIHKWARSRDRWWRRAALVSTVPLNKKSRGGSGDTSRTVDICRRLAKDHDEMVAKALSWALRELVLRDSRSVKRFLREHEDVLAKRVLREVRNKLETGLKTPGRASSRMP
jgi:3-methyladenine DNA glycosylase AlkD